MPRRRDSESQQHNQYAGQYGRLNATKNPLPIPENEKRTDKRDQQYLRRVGVLRVECVTDEIPNLMPLNCKQGQGTQQKQDRSASRTHLRGAS